MKNQKPIFKFCVLSFAICVIMGCGKKVPIGYELVKGRAGEIKVASGSVSYSKSIADTFYCMTWASYLFAGKGGNFEARSFLRFKIDTDTVVTPESLWVVGQDSGKIYVYKILGTINMDSLIWSNAPVRDSFILLDSMNVLKDSVSVANIENYGADTVFYIGLCGTGYNMASINSYHSGKKLCISLKGDSVKRVYANRATYVDTSYFGADSLADSMSMIQSGELVSQCSLYVNVGLGGLVKRINNDTTIIPLDTAIEVDSLTDSLRHLLKLDSAVVNKAVFKIWIDTAKSYKFENKYIIAKYKDKSASEYPSGDSLVFNVSSIIEKWFKEGDKLSFILIGGESEISRVVFRNNSAKLDITYTLPPKSRE